MTAAACAHSNVYRDPKMDFGSIYTVAVMPFTNLSTSQTGADRTRDVLMTMLLATGDVYVVPPGEVARQVMAAGIANPASPSTEETMKVGKLLKADAIVTGVIREYGEVRSGAVSANVLSMSIQITEIQTGKVVFTASSTRGGIGFLDRLFGGGGEPMNTITEKTVKDVIHEFFK